MLDIITVHLKQLYQILQVVQVHHMWCDQAKSVWSQSNSVFILQTVCTIFTATFCRKPHWNWSVGSKDMTANINLSKDTKGSYLTN